MAVDDEGLLLEYTGKPEALAEAKASLEKYGDAFRYQLVMAVNLRGRAAYLEELRAGGQLKQEDVHESYVKALRDIADELYAGEFIPSGWAYRDTIEGTAY